MIKFFRKIRQQLLGEGNLRKYFVYAIGEILLVVIGILIALMINDWNENKKNRATESYYLTQLSRELKSDIGAIEYQLTFIKSISPLINSLLAVLHEDAVTMPVFNDAMATYLNIGLELKYFKSNNSTYEEMKPSGKLGLIVDKVLRNTIVSLYTRIGALEEIFEEYNNFGRPYVQDFMIDKQGAKFMDIQKINFEKYTSAQELFDMRIYKDDIIKFLLNESWSVNEYIPILTAQLVEIELVVELIEEYNTQN